MILNRLDGIRARAPALYEILQDHTIRLGPFLGEDYGILGDRISALYLTLWPSLDIDEETLVEIVKASASAKASPRQFIRTLVAELDQERLRQTRR